MNGFIAGVLAKNGGVADLAAVEAARVGYLNRYGATLLGMMHHHQVDAAEFLAAAHRFDHLKTMLRAERGVGNTLSALPGQKILLTNAPLRYSSDVVRHFGLQRHFSHHIAIESMRVHGRLRPKPSQSMLRQLVARHRIPAHRCILVEDTLANLKAAKALGMRTVWMTGYLRHGLGQAVLPIVSGSALRHAADVAKLGTRPAYVDVRIRSLRQLLDALPRLVLA